MDKSAKIYIAGHRGLVGSALMRQLDKQGYRNLVVRTHAELDLVNQQAVADFFDQEKPEYVFLAAAKVGGIYANNAYPAEFIHDNLAIQTNVIHQSYLNNVKRLLFLGSSCIYPKNCPQPIKEEYLLTSELEATNRPYALAKIAGIEMCWSYNRQYGTQYLSAMPTNLFGPEDNYNLETSHVLPALMRKFHLAKLASIGDMSGIEQDVQVHGKLPQLYRNQLIEAIEKNITPRVEVWGSGRPKREFLYSEDMAEACLFLMNMSHEDYKQVVASESDDMYAPIVNVGVGEDISIANLAKMISEIVGFQGETVYNNDMPDGTSQKLMCIEKMSSLGWKASLDFRAKLSQVYKAYLSNIATSEGVS